MFARKIDVIFSQEEFEARYKIEDERSVLHAVEFEDGPVAVNWDNADVLDIALDDLRKDPEPGASFADCPAAAQSVRGYVSWGKDYRRWLRQNEHITLYRSKRFRLISEATETEGDRQRNGA